ncbi:hypothetical protein EPUS_00815 [Endocarpon pusillum Z07020]|uniref:Uncharacterized protein n=1 Tax=Endocarpon pusillum (strain Z07020 / HMAS-L-300199) TaxID=1263415 RepID=U1HVH4_ENDPU|nr:uncharacterized protein EPUS_00815 [Endocarpon pusillum Z07020]ERF74685.1 hypothetical protein EPUS_00815 [Endocarpon pusillum Z07020]
MAADARVSVNEGSEQQTSNRALDNNGTSATYKPASIPARRHRSHQRHYHDCHRHRPPAKLIAPAAGEGSEGVWLRPGREGREGERWIGG